MIRFLCLFFFCLTSQASILLPEPVKTAVDPVPQPLTCREFSLLTEWFRNQHIDWARKAAEPAQLADQILIQMVKNMRADIWEKVVGSDPTANPTEEVQWAGRWYKAHVTLTQDLKAELIDLIRAGAGADFCAIAATSMQKLAKNIAREPQGENQLTEIQIAKGLRVEAEHGFEILLQSFALALDPHSYFSNLELTQRFASRSSSSPPLGMATFSAMLNGQLVLTNVAPDGPAGRAGVRREDVWESLEGKKIGQDHCDLICLSALLERTVSPTVHAKVRKPDGRIVPVTIERQPIFMDDASAWSDHDYQTQIGGQDLRVGYLKLTRFAFTANAGRNVVEKLAALEKSTDALVLDLTGNSGGSTTTMTEVIEGFLGVGTYGKAVARQEQASEIYAGKMGGRPVYSHPVIVLVDYQTVSAAEFTCAVLRDYRRAIVVGLNGAERTFQKGTSYQYYYLGRHGDGLEAITDLNSPDLIGTLGITRRFSYLPSGQPTQATGCPVDIVLPKIAESALSSPDYALGELAEINVINRPGDLPSFADEHLFYLGLQQFSKLLEQVRGVGLPNQAQATNLYPLELQTQTAKYYAAHMAYWLQIQNRSKSLTGLTN